MRRASDIGVSIAEKPPPSKVEVSHIDVGSFLLGLAVGAAVLAPFLAFVIAATMATTEPRRS